MPKYEEILQLCWVGVRHTLADLVWVVYAWVVYACCKAWKAYAACLLIKVCLVAEAYA